MSQKRILVVDDEHLIRWSLSQMLAEGGYLVETAEDGHEADIKLRQFKPHMVLLDICLPDANGMDLLKKFKAVDEDLLIIMITAYSHADSAVNALKLGAEDYIGKPFNLESVQHCIDQVFEKWRLKEENAFYRQVLQKKFETDNLVGNCPKMIEVFKMIKVAADADDKTVLVLGPSGTGKELVARGIHMHSSRAEQPFIEVNCAAIPETLLENELFGHERGAYTDASRKQKGMFELAQRGTVFLDEIGDMPIGMQAKILKVIEDKRYRRLGGEDEVAIDARIIAATNQNLQKLVKEGKFRADLFYRLDVMTISLPTLRERKMDIPQLVAYFIERFNDEYGRQVEDVDARAMDYLMNYSWPGNVRELRNTIERAMMLEEGRTLGLDHLCAEVVRHHEGRDGEDCRTPAGSRRFSPDQLELPAEGISLEEVEKRLIQLALERWDGNQTKAAECLRMSRDTLRYRIKKFNFGKAEKQGRDDNGN
ncbi:MAG: sigma-54-dependent Fis family transcriptional regulator [Deltaproteobacteria bacterium]|nr:sigma-54-dependent Fis family transcriptional regulator [Candidatus Anaeroferrophillus wilburensis]MBN2888534.1 sigma-54-dependent Fis family transcriptional regulator [Deltaproteobacteria bacterium]